LKNYSIETFFNTSKSSTNKSPNTNLKANPNLKLPTYKWFEKRSIYTLRPVSEQICFAREVGLGGDIRAEFRIENHIAEAKKLGIKNRGT
jgi:hypothetical protein